LIYNHPGRRDFDPEENYRDYSLWQAQRDLFVGLEGGPGHQKATQPGDYQGRIRPKNRWDPVVADIGGTWDQLLDEGHQVWGALAVSDYHGTMDHEPCAFARTIFACRSETRGVLQLRAGLTAGHVC
jgi:hypothetical protein